jgi:hypothetical protein
MRTAIILILLCIGAVSCNKGNCWECDVNADGVMFKETFCERSKKEIRDMQNTPLETKDNGGTVVYTTTFSNCVKK